MSTIATTKFILNTPYSAWFCYCCILFVVISSTNHGALGIHPMTAIFSFGDSVIDSGNNNHLKSLAKANYLPYGMNFPGAIPTGRFVDGFNALDYLAIKVGLPLVPAYARVSNETSKMLHGVNFASGASGIMGYTGANFGKVFSLEMQVKQFGRVKGMIESLIGEDATIRLLSGATYLIVAGSNDWLNTYFFPGSPLPKLYTIPEYRDILIHKLFSHIQDLYLLGARKIIVAGLGALGCCPSQLRGYKSENGACIKWLNDLCSDFNENLQVRLLDLPNSLPNASFAYLDFFALLSDAVNNPSLFGLTEVHHACCGIGKYGGFLNCFPNFPVCENASDYLFWDAYHTTSKFSKEAVDLIWEKGPPYIYPRSGKDLFQNAI